MFQSADFGRTDYLLAELASYREEKQDKEWRNDVSGAVRTLEGFRLITAAHVPVIELIDQSTQNVGWVLGWPISIREQSLLSELTSDGRLVIRGDLSSLRESARKWCGRYLIILFNEVGCTVIPDAAASFSAAYSTDRAVVASRPDLIANNAQAPDVRKSELDALRKSSGDWYPAGLTNWPSIKLLKPNHVLTLPSMTTAREMPTARREYLKPVTSGVMLKTVVQILKSSIRAICSKGMACMPLTAGQDSRMLLSVSRDYLDRILFFTTTKNLSHDSADYQIPKQLAKLHSLNYESVPTLEDLSIKDRPIMLGFGGEVTSAFYWSSRWRDRLKPLTASQLCSRLQYGVSSPPPVVEAVESWRQTLRHVSRPTLLDLLYHEIRLGCTMGPVLNSYDAVFPFAFYPFNAHDLFDMSRRLFPWYRYGAHLRRDVCAQEWPELQSLPYG